VLLLRRVLLPLIGYYLVDSSYHFLLVPLVVSLNKLINDVIIPRTEKMAKKINPVLRLLSKKFPRNIPPKIGSAIAIPT